MADSSIEWTNKVWNPVVGCTRVSAGCEHCYAERLAHRLARMGQAQYAGLTRKLPNGEVRWTGKAVCLPERLAQPLKWAKPQRIFVNSMSDLFHEDVPDEFIAYVFGAMALAQQHTFQVLTKRPQRMLRWMTEERILETTGEYVAWAAEQVPGYQRIVWDSRGSDPDNYIGSMTPRFASKDERNAHYAARRRWPGWPLPNVWLGVSVEDQRSADERIPLLLQTPAAVRFLSCEPLLGAIELSDVSGWGAAAIRFWGERILGSDGISWVIAGGESGPGYRPMDLAWIRSLRDQCKAASVPFFAKQNSGPRTHMWLPEDLQSHEFPESAREVVRER